MPPLNIPEISPEMRNTILMDYFREQITDAPLRPAAQKYRDAGLLAVEGVHVRDYDTYVAIADLKAPIPSGNLREHMLRAADRRPLKTFHAGDSYADLMSENLSPQELHDLMAGMNLKLLSLSQGQISLSDALLRKDVFNEDAYSFITFFECMQEVLQANSLPADEEATVVAACEAEGADWKEKSRSAIRTYYAQQRACIDDAKTMLGLMKDAPIAADDYTRLEFLTRGKIWAEASAATMEIDPDAESNPELAGKVHLAKQIWNRLKTNASKAKAEDPAPELTALKVKRATQLLNDMPDDMLEALTAGDVPIRYGLAPIMSPKMMQAYTEGSGAVSAPVGQFVHPQGIIFVSEGEALSRYFLQKLGAEIPPEMLAAADTQKLPPSTATTIVHEGAHAVHLWDFAHHKVYDEAVLETRLPLEPVQELAQRMEKVRNNDAGIKEEFMQSAGGTEEEWQKLRALTEQCRNILDLDSDYYKAYYDESQVPLEVVGDYFVARYVLAKDSANLMQFIGPQMDQFCQHLLSGASGRQQMSRSMHNDAIANSGDAASALWEVDLPNKFADKITRQQFIEKDAFRR